MLGRKQEINLKLTQFLDALLVGASFLAGYSIRSQGAEWFDWDSLPPIERFYWQMLILVPFTPLVLERMGFYAHPLQKTVAKSLRQLVQALTVMVLVIGIVVIFARKVADSRAVLLIFPFVAFPALLAREALTRMWLRGKIREREWRENVIFAGPPAEVDKLIASLPPEHLAEMEIVDRIDISQEPIERLVDSLHRNAVERVVFAAAHVHFSRIEQCINACELEGVEAWLWSDFIQTSIARPTFDALGEKPMLVFRCTPEASWELLIKGVIDRVGAAVLLFFTLPLWIFAAIGIRLSSEGPVFFAQMRSGRYGRPFRMFKFRTMVTDAEARRKDLADRNEMTGPVFKIENDPRIFRFGRFLRKWSIDELPQLINVLRGEMSLVGPRPLPVYEVNQISESAQRRRLSVKPGLTCLWQVSGRNKITDFSEWVELDLRYIDNWSLWLDITILFRTVPAVFLGNGAK